MRTSMISAGLANPRRISDFCFVIENATPKNGNCHRKKDSYLPRSADSQHTEYPCELKFLLRMDKFLLFSQKNSKPISYHLVGNEELFSSFAPRF